MTSETETFSCTPEAADAALAAWEQTGRRGMRLEREGVGLRIAEAAVDGPYAGSAAGALDDAGRLHCAGATGDLVADAARLAASISVGAVGFGRKVPVFYPGPYRRLILADGSMIRRGRATLLPVDRARELEQRDGAWLDAGPLAEGAAEPARFPEEHAALGSACLRDDPPAKDVAPLPARPLELGALATVTEPMKRRLLAMAARGDEYFILSGSDPAQADGCCPSNDVGEANRLVQAGVLDSWGGGANAACPTTIYAFAGEIGKNGNRPAFTRNSDLREAVKGRLEHNPGRTFNVALRLFFVALLVAAAVAALWGLVRS